MQFNTQFGVLAFVRVRTLNVERRIIVIKIIPQTLLQSQMTRSVNSFEYFKEKVTAIFHKFFQITKKGTHPNIFYEAKN